jgi:hypothetical protein
VLQIRIRGFFDPWIRDPGWQKNPDPGKNQDPPGANNPDHISESLKTTFWVKILNNNNINNLFPFPALF